MMNIDLKIDNQAFTVELFDHPIARELLNLLPLSIDLTCWGNEAYGDIALRHKSVKPQPTIPPGGLAYSEQGPYLCLFYGQTPAWPVDYIGQLQGDEWKALVSKSFRKMTLSR